MFGCFAAVGSAALALTEEKISSLWPLDSDRQLLTVSPQVKLARFVPKRFSGDPGFVRSQDMQVVVCIDGYLIADSSVAHSGLVRQAALFAEECRRVGTYEALRSLEAGAFTILVVDLFRQEFFAVGDPFGSLLTFHSHLRDGWLVSTNPLSLAKSGLIDLEPDMTALAQWVQFGYAFGDRYAVRGIKLLQIGQLIRFNLRSLQGEVPYEPNIVWNVPQHARTPSPDEVADKFLASCRLLQRIDPRPAHLQSAGLDSRLILAAWPDGYNPPCYTYGDPTSHEIPIARSIADARGSAWIHTWQHGDEVAENIETMFRAGGNMMWPDRLFAAREMVRNGHCGVLDGLAGDACLGGSLYGFNRFFPRSGRWGNLFSRLIDERVSRVGIDRLAEVIYTAVLQVHDLESLRPYVTSDFIAAVRAEKLRILEDIHSELKLLQPANSDSVALLWRNVLLNNRGPHMTILQSVMCRTSVNVYTPFVNDRAFVTLLMGLKPEYIAYHRLYLKVYRRRFPKYADLLWNASLLPVRRPVLNHKLSLALVARGITIPFVSGRAGGRQRDPNGWAIWLQESRALREYASDCLQKGAVLDSNRAANTFREIAEGRREGGGKLFHLAAVARWLALARS
ncbi:MAG: hypothetical protein AB1644_04270 [Candidatus Zixiibacteriota bacterium]